VKYAFIEPRRMDYPIPKAGTALSVTASGFHAWKDRPDAQRTLDAQRLLFQIKTRFNQYQRRYGAPRIYRELMEPYGYDGSLARVKRLMRQAGLRAKAKRKFKATTDSNPAHPSRLALPGGGVGSIHPSNCRPGDGIADDAAVGHRCAAHGVV
jgi:putative transposase